jgi:hypothetical protein
MNERKRMRQQTGRIVHDADDELKAAQLAPNSLQHRP